MSDFQPNYPTLLYPFGGESIFDSELTIQWQIPDPLSTDGSIVSYEIYYTDEFDALKEPNWKQIAVVPSSVSQYVWRFANIRSSTVRVAIRSRNSRGQRSIWSISADNFSIRRKQLDPPTIISPQIGDRIDRVVEIAFDNSGIIGTYSQRSTYQFYFSSDSTNTPLTPIAQNVQLSDGNVQWITINLPPAKDYVLQAYLADDDGNVSESVFITSIEIAHEGFFVIDTKPPEASIVINNNDTFTRDQNVTISIVSYDEATAVHSIEFVDGGNTSVPEPATDVSHYTLSDGDAIKSVGMLAQDYGGNRNNGQIQRLFETIVEEDGGVKVVDITLDNTSSTAWAITSAPYNYLYKIKLFPSLVMAFEDEPTAVSVFGSLLYVATKSTIDLGTLMLYNGYEAVVIQSFTDPDSIINAMTVHGSNLFLGMENGVVYKFDGLTFTKLTGVDNPVKTLVSDGSLLYLTERNGTDVYVFNGTAFVSTGA